MVTGALETLPDDVVIESGVLFVGDTPFATSVGGLKFDPGKEIRNIPYDGKRSDVQGLDRIVGWNPRLSLTIQELGIGATGAQLATLEAGSTEAESGHIHGGNGLIQTITPKPAGEQFADGDYISDLRGVWELHGGGFVVVHFPIALCDKYGPMEGADKAEGKIPCEFKAVLSMSDAASDPGKCPYTIERRTQLPS